MHDLGKEPTAKKTLMNAVERLTVTANRFDDLSNLSEMLVAKFERTEGMPRNPEGGGESASVNTRPDIPDIIDLFNGINHRLDNLLNKIGNNVEKVISMID